MIYTKQLLPRIPQDDAKEQISELKGKIQLRTKDKRVVFAISQQAISENDTEIKFLKEEVKDTFQIERQLNGPYSQQRIISRGLRQSRRSKLAFLRLPVETAINYKQYQFFDKVNDLNESLSRKVALERKLRDLQEEAAYFPQFDSGNNQEFEKKKRVLATKTDKMKMKAETAKFVEKLYKQMIDRMKKDRLYQPKTLQSLESRVEEAKVEINSCLQTTLRDSKQTYKNSKVLLDQMESTFIKNKRGREKSISELRKKFKNLKFINAYEEREHKLRKQKTLLGSHAGFEDLIQTSQAGDLEAKQSKTPFETLRLALDELYEKTSVENLSDISTCLQNQTKKCKELLVMIAKLSTKKKNLLRTKKKFEEKLKEAKMKYQNTVDKTQEMKEKLEEKIETKNEVREKSRKRAHQLLSLQIRVTESIEELSSKIYSWQLNIEEPKIKDLSHEDERIGSLANLKSKDDLLSDSENLYDDEMKTTMRTASDSRASFGVRLAFRRVPEPIDSVEKLQFCCDHLMEITRTASRSALNESALSVMQELRDFASTDQNYEVLASIQSKNSRVSFGLIQNFYMENFLYHDHLDNEEFLSRENVKEMARVIVDAKTLNLKRKKKLK